MKQMYIHHIANSDFNKFNNNDSITSNISDNSFPMGWALPQKRFTRFSFCQLKYIYDLLIQGETTGCKATPEKVFNDMKNLRINRNKYLSPNEYLSVSQIKSLFSRYSKLKREGKLKPPTEKVYLSDECLQNEIVNETNESSLIVQEEFTREILSKVSTPNYSVVDWMLVKYHATILVGTIKEIADNEYHVACMHECGPNQFKWPSQTDSCWYKSIICMIKGPIPINNCGVFQLSDDDFDSFKNLSH